MEFKEAINRALTSVNDNGKPYLYFRSIDKNNVSIMSVNNHFAYWFSCKIINNIKQDVVIFKSDVDKMVNTKLLISDEVKNQIIYFNKDNIQRIECNSDFMDISHITNVFNDFTKISIDIKQLNDFLTLTKSDCFSYENADTNTSIDGYYYIEIWNNKLTIGDYREMFFVKSSINCDYNGDVIKILLPKESFKPFSGDKDMFFYFKNLDDYVYLQQEDVFSFGNFSNLIKDSDTYQNSEYTDVILNLDVKRLKEVTEIFHKSKSELQHITLFKKENRTYIQFQSSYSENTGLIFDIDFEITGKHNIIIFKNKFLDIISSMNSDYLDISIREHREGINVSFGNNNIHTDFGFDGYQYFYEKKDSRLERYQELNYYKFENIFNQFSKTDFGNFTGYDNYVLSFINVNNKITLLLDGPDYGAELLKTDISYPIDFPEVGFVITDFKKCIDLLSSFNEICIFDRKLHLKGNFRYDVEILELKSTDYEWYKVLFKTKKEILSNQVSTKITNSNCSLKLNSAESGLTRNIDVSFQIPEEYIGVRKVTIEKGIFKGQKKYTHNFVLYSVKMNENKIFYRIVS